MDCKNSVKFHYPSKTGGTNRRPGDDHAIDIQEDPGDGKSRSTSGSAAAFEATWSGRRVEQGADTSHPAMSAEQRMQVTEDQERFAEVRAKRLNDRAAQIVRLERHAGELESRRCAIPLCSGLMTATGGMLSLTTGMSGVITIGGVHPGVTLALLAGSVLSGGSLYSLHRYLLSEEAIAAADTPRTADWIADLRARQAQDAVTVALEERVPPELAEIILEYAPPASPRRRDSPDA